MWTVGFISISPFGYHLEDVELVPVSLSGAMLSVGTETKVT